MNEVDWLLAGLRGVCILVTYIGVVDLTEKRWTALCAATLVGFSMMYLETLAKLVAP